MTADRIACLVPFCRRTRRREPDDPEGCQWICGPHWLNLPKTWRRCYSRARRRWKRADAFGTHNADGSVTFTRKADWLEERRAARAGLRLWRRLMRAAVERAAGVG